MRTVSKTGLAHQLGCHVSENHGQQELSTAKYYESTKSIHGFVAALFNPSVTVVAFEASVILAGLCDARYVPTCWARTRRKSDLSFEYGITFCAALLFGIEKA
jgi:hypothetical protein